MTALRVPFAVGSGTLLSLSLFWLLWIFVDAPLDMSPLVQPLRIEFTRQVVDTPTAIPRDEKVVRKPPPVIVDPPRIGHGDPDVDTGTTVVQPVVDTGEVSGTKLTPGPDRDAIPLVRVEPEYPPRALRGNIEGWVQVRFTITATGAVQDPIVVAAEPPSIFDDAALRAIARWRYQPKVEGGVAVERVGLQTVIRFTLEQ